MIEGHTHNGFDSPRIDANYLTGNSVITAELAVSSRTVQPSVIQRGTYTLATGVKLVVFPQPYSSTTQLMVFTTPTINASHYLQGIVVSAFTVSGSGSETGNWMSIGYK